MSVEALRVSSPALHEWKLTEAIFVGVVLVAALIMGIWFAPSVRTVAPIWLHVTYFQRSQLSLLIALMIELAAVSAVVVAICKFRGISDPLSSIGWNLNRYAALSACAGFGLAAVISVTCVLAFGGVKRFSDGFAPISILLYLITTVSVQPFVEECYFRGILFIAASKRFGQFGTVALTTLLFAVFHVGGYRWILVFVTVGVVLGITRIKTRSVAACFVLHAAYNFGMLVAGLVPAR